MSYTVSPAIPVITSSIQNPLTLPALTEIRAMIIQEKGQAASDLFGNFLIHNPLETSWIFLRDLNLEGKVTSTQEQILDDLYMKLAAKCLHNENIEYPKRILLDSLLYQQSKKKDLLYNMTQICLRTEDFSTIGSVIDALPKNYGKNGIEADYVTNDTIYLVVRFCAENEFGLKAIEFAKKMHPSHQGKMLLAIIIECLEQGKFTMAEMLASAIPNAPHFVRYPEPQIDATTSESWYREHAMELIQNFRK